MKFVLFSGRSTVLATKLGERLSAHRKEAQSAHCEARVKSLVDEAKKLGWMPASLLSMLKGTGDASATEAAAASPNDEGLGGADASVVCATSSDIDEQAKVALGLDFVVRMANDDMLRPPRPNATVTEPTPIRKEKQANERRMRFSAVALADWWGHGDPTRTHEDRQQIATAACRQVACDHTVMPSQPVVLSFTSGETSSTKALLMASAIPSAERRFVEGRHART